jgi:2-polyprenyl-3-methyl-5-hydroxy-6-metoxy-1,4-benzoquinol methylase
MNYREQEKFLRGSRISGAVVCCLFLGALGLASLGQRWIIHASAIVFSFMAAALAVSIYYTPDYLHLSVTPERKSRWAVKIRWRIAGAVLVLGMLLASTAWDRLVVLAAFAWLSLMTLLAKKVVPQQHVPVFFWISDWALLIFAMLGQSIVATVLVPAAAAHLLVVSIEKRQAQWAAVAIASGLLLLLLDLYFVYIDLGVAVTALGTVWLVRRARRQNAKNVGAALQELIEFTGYPADRIRQLWATSNQQLAANWEAAKPSEDDPGQMAEWYRQNSELYLFAISGYNLEYKRIRSNMKVLRLARGATLDYGAGNGEILLELARRGQPAAYYDVEGVTMRFARHRAERQRLAIDFFTTKDALAAAARQHGFDTVFSFDALEHLPDLPGELEFLSSLLAPGGVFVFDVPAGSTRAHPMHLNHNLNVLEFMKSRGLKDERGILLRLPLRKEEKFVFRKSAVSGQHSALR